MRKSLLLATFAVLAAGAVATQVVALPDSLLFPNSPVDFSGNGRYVLINSLKVDMATHKMPMLPLPPEAAGSGYYRLLSYDGQTQFGECDIAGQLRGFARRYGVFTILPGLDGPFTDLYACDDSGQVVAGNNWDPLHFIYGARWDSGQMTGLGGFQPDSVSGDGSVIFAHDGTGSSSYLIGTVPVPMKTFAWASPQVADSSFNGLIAVGGDTGRAFRWKRGQGFQDLGHLPGPSPRSWASSLTRDGSMVAGQTDDDIGQPEAFIYKDSFGIVRLRDYLASLGANVTDWGFISAEISANGEAVFGLGTYRNRRRWYHVWIAGDHLTVNIERERILPGGQVTGIITFAKPAAVGRTIALSSNSTNLTVPASVFVPANATRATFVAAVSGSSPGDVYTVSAQSGGLSASDDIEVVARLVRLEMLPLDIHSGNTARARVSLDRQTNVHVTIGMLYGSPLVSGPSEVRIPAGTNSLTFTIRSRAFSEYAASLIVASDNRVPYFNQEEDNLRAHSALEQVSVTPDPMSSNGLASGVISTTHPAPAGGLAYGLRSLSSLLTVPPGVTMAASASSVSFTIQAGFVNTAVTRTIEARFKSATKTVQVTIMP